MVSWHRTRRYYKTFSSATSIYAYDGDNLVEETNATGAAVARYSQGLNIDEPLAMLRSATTSYYQADGLGSVTSLTNSAGAAAQTYTYDSFGNITASSGSLTNPFRYTSRESDTETGLYYYRARYYDPMAGRFLSEDPAAGTTGELDFYSYVDNHPTGLTDPSRLNTAAPAIPWPRVLPYPISIPLPWIKVGGGIIVALLGDALVPQPTSSTDTPGKDDPLPDCKRKRECADQYARDLLWCEFMFANNLPLLMRCYEIADQNLENCLDGKPPVEPDPEKNPGPKGPPPGGPKPPIPFPGKGKSR